LESKKKTLEDIENNPNMKRMGRRKSQMGSITKEEAAKSNIVI
jgi:hypothetical protein